MFLDYIPITSLTSEHLQRLISDRISESRELDYKLELYGSNDQQRRELAKDVSAFANTNGGHIIIGISEAEGLPIDLLGVSGDTDSEKLRLSNMISSNIRPGLVGVEIGAVRVTEERSALVIRIPASWNPPHQASVAGWTKYFLRTSAGADEMDVEQLRSVFLKIPTLNERVRGFRDARVQCIKENKGVRRLYGPGVALVHIVPLGGLQRSVDLGRERIQLRPFSPIPAGFSDSINFDGYLVHTAVGSDGAVSEYTQVFRNGNVEVALGEISVEVMTGRPRVLNYKRLRDGLSLSLPSYVRALEQAGFGPPFIVLVSLLGIDETTMQTRPDAMNISVLLGTNMKLDRSELILEPVELNESKFLPEWQKKLRPLLDTLWNAYGEAKCPDFGSDGTWQPISL